MLLEGNAESGRGKCGMLLNNIVDYCYNDYWIHRHNCFCDDSCSANCNVCLEKIHFNKVLRHYDCRSMIDYYVCKYIYRQASEMAALLRCLPWPRALRSMRVLSIGCGSCSDLYAFLYHMAQKGSQLKLQYLGVDKNYLWQLVHRCIVHWADDYNLDVAFKYANVLDLFNKDDVRNKFGLPDVLVMQYFLSDMARVTAVKNMCQLIDDIVCQIIKRMPDGSLIIINDINARQHTFFRQLVSFPTARYYFEYLEQQVLSLSPRSKVWKFHFPLVGRRKYYRYGWKHPGNDILFAVPAYIKKNFSPWEKCGSAQLVIRKGF